MTMNKIHPTLELGNVFKYMQDTLVKEFPTNLLTPEYLVLSILDTQNNHAYMLLENILDRKNLDDLRDIFGSAMHDHTSPIIGNGFMAIRGELERLMSCAGKEAAKSDSKEVGTEHVLLAMLNKDNNFNIREIFDKFSINYDFIYNTCNNKQEKKTKEKNMEIPLKSQVNQKMVIDGSAEAIKEFTVNINEMARRGEIDKIVGRNKEMLEIVKILSRRKKNNVIIVGDGGVGKTACVYNLARMIEEGEAPEVMSGKEIVMLDHMSLMSGTHFRGIFEDRMKKLVTELGSSDKYIFFVDDIQNVLKSGGKDKDSDISGLIGGALSEGKVRVIGTCTFKEYRNAIESNPSLSRKFQKIVIEPNTNEETVEILHSIKGYYEDFHNVRYSDEVIQKIVDLSQRYVTDRNLPDSAIDVLDLAGASTVLVDNSPDEIKGLKERLRELSTEKSKALNNGEFESVDALNNEENSINAKIAEYKRNSSAGNGGVTEITENDVANVVSEMTGIPVNKLTLDEKAKLANIDSVLKKSIIGQDEAIDEICKSIKRSRMGLSNQNAPIGTFLMCGPSGVGKTLLAKKIAEQVFGDENALIRIDMSEYSEKNSVAKLMGTSPGYIGFENGGQLTEAIKHKQHCVLLLDEIEKADQEVYNVFLQLFDEGRMTDGAGQTVNFKNVIIFMTSNIGARKAAEFGHGIGFSTNEESNKKSIIEKEIKRRFNPEFINRINKIIYFNSLTDDNLKNIVKLELNKFNKKLNDINYNIVYNDDVITHIQAEAIKDKEYGARPITRIIENSIEDEITELMLTNDFQKNHTFSASVVDDKISIT